VTYYLLPLISLNKFSFGPPENFINAYLSEDHSEIIVKVKDSDKVFPIVWSEAPVNDFTATEIFFEVPSQFAKDIKRFLRGEYSKFSSEAKAMIVKNSGLTYMKQRVTKEGTNVIDIDARLRALDPTDSTLREFLEDQLGMVIDPKLELISLPTEEEIWKEQRSPIDA
jgi:hypothetical protein